MSDSTKLSLVALREAIARGEVSPSQAVSDSLKRIAETEPKLDALLHVAAQSAEQSAKELEKAGKKPEQTLYGVPVVVKDAICVKDMPNTCASKILENFKPFYDAEAVARLKKAGAVIIAKSNLDEFAMGSSTENSAYKITKNPYDLSKVPGGSSGGSAASVCAGQCSLALGTDTGGSIRQPASFCGVVGLKPTYGRVSRFGLVAYGSSLDQIGPFTRSVEDCAAVLAVLAGHDAKDSTSSPEPVEDYEAAVAATKDLQGLTLGLPEEYWGEGSTPEVRQACEAAIDAARAAGAKIEQVKLPHTPYAIAAYYIVAMAEASSNLARFDGVRYGLRDKSAKELVDLYEQSRSAGFGDEVQRRIMLGAYVLSAGYYDAYYKKAAQARRLIRQDFLDAFAKCDIVVGPTSPFTAFGIGEKTGDPLQMYLSDIFTISLNLAGLPGLSLPVGLGSESKLPVGLQMIAPAFGEAKLLGVAAAIARTLGPLAGPPGF